MQTRRRKTSYPSDQRSTRIEEMQPQPSDAGQGAANIHSLILWESDGVR
jgi:hypothetical protein